MKAVDVRASKLPEPTPDENLRYVHGMLRELHAKAAQEDELLGYFIEMALLQAVDIINGVRKAEPSALTAGQPPSEIQKRRPGRPVTVQVP